MGIKSVLLQGDCLEMLKELPDESVDSLVTDPPAGISFMSKAWDDDKGGRKQWIAWMSQVMQECLRVMKPGAHGLVWAIPRTSHWTATALEDAGFEIRDVVTHLFGSGFPKSLDISKAIDKSAGAEREVIGFKIEPDGRSMGTEPLANARVCNPTEKEDRKLGSDNRTLAERKVVTAPSTQEAKKWQGWGTSLKPAAERWVLVRKPIGTMDSIVLSLKQLEDLWLKLNVLSVGKNSKFIQHGSKKAKESTAQGSVQIHTEVEKEKLTETGVEVDLLEQMDMSQLETAKTISLNIVSSWKSILEESLEVMNTCTTKTKINPTIDFQTLNSLILEITPENIIQAVSNQNGPTSFVHIVNQSLDVLKAFLLAIQTPSAQESVGRTASSNLNTQRIYQENEVVSQTAPSSEDYILIRKPCSEKTVAANVLKHGTGGINIDASRITTADNLNGGAYSKSGRSSKMNGDDREGKSLGLYESGKTAGTYNQPQGRFPANLLLSHNSDCVEVGVKKVKGSTGVRGAHKNGTSYQGSVDKSLDADIGQSVGYCDQDGAETVSAFECTEGCAVAELDRQSGNLKPGGNTQFPGRGAFPIETTERMHYKESGGASRFFYCAKPSKREKNAGCEGLPTVMSKTMMRGTSGSGTKNFQGGFQDHLTLNNHPTVKSTKLMSYLITMITPSGGIVLDPFMGSGSTGVAAVKEGFDFIGIEKENEYYNIAEMRIGNAEGSNGKADNNQDPTAA